MGKFGCLIVISFIPSPSILLVNFPPRPLLGGAFLTLLYCSIVEPVISHINCLGSHLSPHQSKTCSGFHPSESTNLKPVHWILEFENVALFTVVWCPDEPVSQKFSMLAMSSGCQAGGNRTLRLSQICLVRKQSPDCSDDNANCPL